MGHISSDPISILISDCWPYHFNAERLHGGPQKCGFSEREKSRVICGVLAKSDHFFHESASSTHPCVSSSCGFCYFKWGCLAKSGRHADFPGSEPAVRPTEEISRHEVAGTEKLGTH
ncbi:hypothetical protein AG1IA_03093 [Rhizoctonia solani AG-1 IA]|uniref:Uncharacterized protein n=1 Tax=Thanatephorus cucumeris (strain AG1-IA) TaxID=983506 RepID=L8WXS1_THACA|nr:hypothetical protein AG1IA_03093 [Rhizoctonia solani AG-1 IA]